jgi:N-methylhydantoinase B
MDVVTLEVLWNRVLSVVNEQQVTLMRTAFSTIVRESQDLACGVFDANGRMIAQSLTGTPGHINAMATGVRHFLSEIPPATLVAGDVLITNDPWQTSGQINDLTIVTPVFRDGRVVAYFANCCHAVDIGGRVFSGEAREIYEEGLRIPIMHLFRAGEPNRVLFDLVRANVRAPDETIGDIYAQTACNDVGARDLLRFMDEFQLDSLDELADEIINRSEQAMRAAIRPIPNGTYEHEAWADGYDEPIRLHVAVTVNDEDILIDFAGSSSESRWGINVVLNYTHAYSSFAIKAAVSPDVPHNAGSFLPVRVTAPEGSILNAREPRAVAARHLLGHMLPCTIFGALAQAMPGKLQAGGAESSWLSVWRGLRRNDEIFTFTLFQSGGAGARATKDGLNANGFPSGVAGVPAEVYEALTPCVQHRRALRPDSGGAGRFRGGVGQHTEMSYRDGKAWSVSPLIDRTRTRGQGLAGGQPGAGGEYVLGDGSHPQPKALTPLAPDARVHLILPGGGGYGDAYQRPVGRVLADVVDGYVTIDGAARDYGVVIRYTGGDERLVRLAHHYTVDEQATGVLRGGRGAGR